MAPDLFPILEHISASNGLCVDRADVASHSREPDADLATLVREGLAEQVHEDLWLILSRRRPPFEVGVPESDDVGETCRALVAAHPHLADLVAAILAFGIAAVRRGVRDCIGVVDETSLGHTRAMIENAWAGIVTALRRRAEKRAQDRRLREHCDLHAEIDAAERDG